jgi:hypothetical protein
LRSLGTFHGQLASIFQQGPVRKTREVIPVGVALEDFCFIQKRINAILHFGMFALEVAQGLKCEDQSDPGGNPTYG